MATSIVLDSGDEDDLEVSIVGEVLAGPALKKTKKALKKSSKKKQARHCRRLKEKHLRGCRADDRSRKRAGAKAPQPPPLEPQPQENPTAAAAAPARPQSSPALPGISQLPAASSSSILTDSPHCRVRSAAEVPAAFCTECRRPLDAAGAAAAIVEFRRPWILGLSRVHAEHRCLQSAGLLSFLTPASQSRSSSSLPETHGVLRSLKAPVAGARIGRIVMTQQRRGGHLAAARQMAAAAAMRAVRRAASDAAGEATSGPGVRRRHQHRSVGQQAELACPVVDSRSSKSDVMFEALLSALPPSKRATREDVPKGERCAVCHGKLLRRGRRVRRLPCGHMFHDACILPWLRKRPVCPLDRKDIAELLGVRIEARRERLGAEWVAAMVQIAATGQLDASPSAPESSDAAVHSVD